jgi:hypothetical protein
MKKQLLVLTLGLFAILFTSAQTSVSVRDLQFVSVTDLAACKDASSYDGQTIKTVGIVMHNGNLTEVASGSVNGGYRPGVHIIDTATGAAMGDFNTIQIHGVYDDGQSQPVAALDNLVAGMIVEVTGEMGGFSGETQLSPSDASSVVVIGTTTAPTPAVVSIGLLNDKSRVNKLPTGEAWEGSLVTVENVTVVAVNAFSGGTRVSFDISDANGNTMNVSDRFIAQKLVGWVPRNASSPQAAGEFVAPIVGTQYESITGIVLHSENGCTGGTGRGYELNPFDTSHYKVGDTPPSITDVTRNPLVPGSTDDVVLSAQIIDFNGTVVSQTLYYTTDINAENTSFTAVPMTLKTGSSDEFEATIPKAADGTIIRYYIKATDNDANESFEPFTATTATGSTSFYTVRDAGLTIVDLQYVLNEASDASPYVGQTVTVKGYITASAKPYDLEDIYLQDKDATEWAGIHLRGSADLLELWRTEEVEVTGVVREAFGFTEIEVTSVSKTGKTAEILPIELPVSDSLGRANDGYEKYESMLVKMVNAGGKVKIADPQFNPFGEWTVADDTAANFANSTKVQAGVKNGNNNSSLWVSVLADSAFETQDGILEVPLVKARQGMEMDALVGIMYYGFGQFAVKPRNNDDLEGFSVELDSAEYAKDTATNAVPTFQALGVTFYPNPASNVITVKTESNTTGNVVVRSLDGRIIASKQVVGRATVNVAALTRGIYVLEFTNDQGQRSSAKFVKL